MKRFYQTAEAVPVPGGFGVRLDAHPLRTPGKRDLILPTEALASAIAREWAEQGAEIRPDRMPLMRFASTALDHVAGRMADVVAEYGKYAATDLLCYRATGPRDLVEREAAAWQPLLDWAMSRFDAPLVVTAGIAAVAQPPASLKALNAVLAGLDALSLTAVADLTAGCGSLILALAVWDGRLDADSAFAASVLDETYEIERWGEDAESAKRRAGLRDDIRAAARFLALLR